MSAAKTIALIKRFAGVASSTIEKTTYIVPSNNTSSIPIGLSYNPPDDDIEVYYKNGILDGNDYRVENNQIKLLGFTANAGEDFYIKVTKGSQYVKNVEDSLGTINDKIDNKMGDVTQLKTQNKSSLVGATNENTDKIGILNGEVDTVKSSLAQIANEKADKIALEVERKRIDLIQANPGSTTGDVALNDIKVGAYGMVYDSPGDAVRSQISDLFNANEYLRQGETQITFSWESGGMDTNTGVEMSSTTRIRNIGYITGDITLKIINNSPASDIWVFEYNVDGTFIKRTTYSNLIIREITINLEKGKKYRLNIYANSGMSISQANYFDFSFVDDIYVKNNLLKKHVVDEISNERDKFDGAYILLDFDYTIYNSDLTDSKGKTSRTRQNLLAEYGYKGTLAVGYTSLTDASSMDIVKESVNIYGWDYACYGINGTSSDYDTYVKPYISNSANISDITVRLSAYVDKCNEVGLYHPVAYFCRNNENGTALARACKNAGFKLIRCNKLDGEDINPITTNRKISNSLSIGTYQFYINNGTSFVKSLIDDAVNNRGVLSIMTHRLFVNITNGNDGDNTIANYRILLDYIKSYEDLGKLKVITWKELYSLMKCETVTLTDIDFKRLESRISALENT